jgi:hypothetical protein
VLRDLLDLQGQLVQLVQLVHQVLPDLRVIQVTLDLPDQLGR